MANTQADPLEFIYYGAPQRSPEWLGTKRGLIGSSRLADWLAVSKAKTGAGKPLKKRLDYEKELMFERQFNTNFEKYFNSAMQDGIDYEDFARKQYEAITGNKCDECGAWANKFFCASPDRIVTDTTALPIPGFNANGLIEVKILKDNSFSEVLMSGVPEKHWDQIQGQLWATKLPWCDYVAVNFNTKKVIIIRVYPDQEFIDYLKEAVQEELVTEPFALTNVHDIVGELPDWSETFNGEDKESEPWA